MMVDPLADSEEGLAPPPPSASPGWMITFADLLSLMLSFFVLMFATTTIDAQDWVRMMQPVTVYFGGTPRPVAGALAPTPPPAATLDLNYLTAALRQLVAEDPALKGARVVPAGHGATISLPVRVTSCRRPLPSFRQLVGLASLLGDVDNRIEVLGHSGIDPTASAAPATWAHALDVASQFAGQLRLAGVTRDIVVTGRADLPGGRAACAIDVILHDDAGADQPATSGDDGGY